LTFQVQFPFTLAEIRSAITFLFYRWFLKTNMLSRTYNSLGINPFNGRMSGSGWAREEACWGKAVFLSVK
jgi:hypothetical protein